VDSQYNSLLTQVVVPSLCLSRTLIWLWSLYQTLFPAALLSLAFLVMHPARYWVQHNVFDSNMLIWKTENQIQDHSVFTSQSLPSGPCTRPLYVT
jgi:hypothetical protein